MLAGLAPLHYAMLPTAADLPRPRACDFYVFFQSLSPAATGGWQSINALNNARRGDIIAWELSEYQDGIVSGESLNLQGGVITWQLPEFQPGHDTGHVFFVAETPTVDKFGIVSVRVYDSAKVAHFDDTRGDGPDQFPNGVGSGIIKFQVDASGAPIAFLFSPSDDPNISFTSMPIAIGRAEPL